MFENINTRAVSTQAHVLVLLKSIPGLLMSCNRYLSALKQVKTSCDPFPKVSLHSLNPPLKSSIKVFDFLNPG